MRPSRPLRRFARMIARRSGPDFTCTALSRGRQGEQQAHRMVFISGDQLSPAPRRAERASLRADCRRRQRAAQQGTAIRHHDVHLVSSR